MEWHNSSQLNNAARTFHDKYARQPLSSLNRAREIHTGYMSLIESHLRKKNICLRLEYTGSSYEGVKVGKNDDDADIEFDVMVVMTQGGKLRDQTVRDRPGYAYLKPREGCEKNQDLQGILSHSGVLTYDYVNADKIRNLFFSEIQKCVNEFKEMSGKVKLRAHGPAVQMDVHPDSGTILWGPKLYSVDIVPAFEVGGSLYVAKPLKEESMPTQAWRRSFSVEEKKKLDVADRNNGCRKQVFRILKVIRNREAGLSKLTSYHLKTALFMVMDRVESWTYMDVGRRLMDVLMLLDQRLSGNNMPHYYMREINLLSGISSSCIQNMKDRIHRLCCNENQMMQLLGS